MSEEKVEEVENPEIHFEPIVKLTPVKVEKLEENEEEIFSIRSKLFRMDFEADPPEWKERGVGFLRILKHQESGKFRLLMRRDKTHKICCNHIIGPFMKLLPNVSSEKAWIWSTNADFADETPRAEQLAARFANVEKAQKFKEAFERCVADTSSSSADVSLNESKESEGLAEELDKLEINKSQDEKEDKVVEKEAEDPVKGNSQEETTEQQPQGNPPEERPVESPKDGTQDESKESPE